jgi:hypothetical protein
LERRVSQGLHREVTALPDPELSPLAT